MSDQEKREKVVRGLECCIETIGMCWDNPKCPYNGYENLGRGEGCMSLMMRDAIALLKAQEPTTAEPKRIELADETKAWLDKMDAVDALDNIADICIDWDGYRTADGLGGLVNEIWAYARYCADRIAKAQEPVKPTIDVRHGKSMWRCGSCSTALQPNQMHAKFCFNCGKAVKWE